MRMIRAQVIRALCLISDGGDGVWECCWYAWRGSQAWGNGIGRESCLSVTI
jgi:hypothetical protein